MRIGTAVFLIMQRLPEGAWQLQNTVTGEWHTFDEDEPSRSVRRRRAIVCLRSRSWNNSQKLDCQKTSPATFLPTLPIFSLWPGTASSI